MNALDILVEEFRSLRHELVTYIQLRYTVLSVFYGAVFTLVATSIGLGKFYLLGIVPGAVLVHEMFTIKLEFYIREIGSYIKVNNQKINSLFAQAPLGWEARWGEIRDKELTAGVKAHRFLYVDFVVATLLWWARGVAGLTSLILCSSLWWVWGYAPLLIGYEEIVRWRREVNRVGEITTFKSLTT